MPSEASPQPTCKLCQVAVPVPLEGTFTYEVPPKLEGLVMPGVRVLVPFGGRKLAGIVTEFPAAVSAEQTGVELKQIEQVLDEAPVRPAQSRSQVPTGKMPALRPAGRPGGPLRQGLRARTPAARPAHSCSAGLWPEFGLAGNRPAGPTASQGRRRRSSRPRPTCVQRRSRLVRPYWQARAMGRFRP
jgi:hypothetical protein